MKIEVRSKIVGNTQLDTLPPNILIDLLNEQITVRELISQAVEEQIRDLLINRKLDIEQTQKMLNRQYLTDNEVGRQAERGAVQLPSAKIPPPLKIDTSEEVSKALHGFEQRAYLVVVDGQQAEHLDEVVTLGATSKVTFLRLTPLVGG